MFELPRIEENGECSSRTMSLHSRVNELEVRPKATSLPEVHKPWPSMYIFFCH